MDDNSLQTETKQIKNLQQTMVGSIIYSLVGLSLVAFQPSFGFQQRHSSHHTTFSDRTTSRPKTFSSQGQLRRHDDQFAWLRKHEQKHYGPFMVDSSVIGLTDEKKGLFDKVCTRIVQLHMIDRYSRYSRVLATRVGRTKTGK